MGEIAEDNYEGRCCSQCGQYFQDPKDNEMLFTHGHPVVCNECWADLSPKERKGLKKATVEVIGGDVVDDTFNEDDGFLDDEDDEENES